MSTIFFPWLPLASPSSFSSYVSLSEQLAWVPPAPLGKLLRAARHLSSGVDCKDFESKQYLIFEVSLFVAMSGIDEALDKMSEWLKSWVLLFVVPAVLT